MDSTKIKDLGNIIRTNRKAQSLTQEQLAAVCGVGLRFLRELESGKESCHIGKTFHVLSMLGLKIKIGERSL